MSPSPFVLASNRGPITFALDDEGHRVVRRGAGGLVSGIGPLLAGTDNVWIAAANSDEDRAVASGGVVEAERWKIRLIDLDPSLQRASYDVVCNQVLWFIHHGLFDRLHGPAFGDEFARAWQAYREVNEAFARAIADSAGEGATVLVQDYHLALVGGVLAEARPDLRTVHFSHTPFATPAELRILPDEYRLELLRSMTRFGRAGFHTQRWASAFSACAEAAGLRSSTFVSPLGTDADDIGAVAASAACADALARLEAHVGDRQVIARIDRIEPSKNLVRGFQAYERLLAHHPEWHGEVTFVAAVYPSRQGLATYRAYRQEVQTVVESLNARWGTDDWAPVLLDDGDDFAASVALMRRADVVLVNAIRDGLNLVASETSLVNERSASLLLSVETGIHDSLAGVVDSIHPLDLRGTAAALDTALRRPADERAERAAALRRAAGSRTPADWLADQLATS